MFILFGATPCANYHFGCLFLSFKLWSLDHPLPLYDGFSVPLSRIVGRLL